MTIDDHIRTAIKRFVEDNGLKPGARILDIASSTLRSYTRNEPSRPLAHRMFDETYDKIYKHLEIYLPDKAQYFSRKKLIEGYENGN